MFLILPQYRNTPKIPPKSLPSRNPTPNLRIPAPPSHYDKESSLSSPPPNTDPQNHDRTQNKDGPRSFLWAAEILSSKEALK